MSSPGISTMALLIFAQSPLLLGCAGVVLVVLLTTITRRATRCRLPLPPGPPAEFLLGHFRLIPTQSPENAYMKWSKECHSDIIYLNALGQHIVVLNSVQAASDLLDKRGANYSDRPRFVLFDVMGWHKTLTFLRQGPEFKLHRRVLQRAFQKSNISQFRPLQEREATTMLKGVLDNPSYWETIVRRFATAIVLGIGFGLDINSDSDPFIQVASDASYALAHVGAPAGTPADFFPLLTSLPSLFHDRSLKFARDWRWAIRDLHDKPFAAVLASGTRNISLVQTLLDQRRNQTEKNQEPDLSIEDVKGAAAAVYAAGQDTTWATIMVFIVNMLLHPGIQSKAQSIIDEVVGRERLPAFSDRPHLIYLDYIVQETLRWCPVSPIGVPHRSLREDEYYGYRIPAGSVVYANARAMTHDERVYHNPEEFNPDRYVPVADGGLGEPFPTGQFGFGRRVCVGRHLAEASVWIVVARLLSVMRIEKAIGENGDEITPEIELTNGLTSHPKSFPCRFVPRDAEAAQLIRQAEVSRRWGRVE